MKTLALQLQNILIKSSFASKTKEEVYRLNPVFVINSFLITTGVLLLLYYIVGSNGVASDSYKIKTLSERLVQVNDEQSALLARKAGIEESFVTIDFAKSYNMVEAKNVFHIFESKNVALQN